MPDGLGAKQLVEAIVAGGSPVVKGEPPATPLPTLRDLLNAAMEGTLEVDRPLKDWEPVAFNGAHMNVLLLHTLGYNGKEIAAETGLDQSRVSVIINHPFARKLLPYLVAQAADKTLDVNKRLATVQGEALEAIIHTMRTTRSERTRLRSAFDLLDRGGYGGVQKSHITHEVVVPKEQAAGITRALDESKQIASVDYSRFLTNQQGLGRQPDDEPHALQPGDTPSEDSEAAA